MNAKTLLMGVAAVVLAVTGWAEEAVTSATPRAARQTAVKERAPRKEKVRKAKDVQVRAGQDFKAVRYGERRADLPDGAPDDRLMDILLPSTPAPASGYPCVVWVHGGGFSHGTRSAGALRTEWLKRGYAVVPVSYYLYRKHKADPDKKSSHPKGEPAIAPERPYSDLLRKSVDTAAEEVEMALKYLAEHAAEYKLDVNRFAIGGSSAGGITSMEIAYIRRKPTGVKIRAVIDFCGAAEHLEKIEKPVPRLVAVHGDKDMVVSPGYCRAIKARLEELGVENKVFLLPGQGHNMTGYVKEHNLAPEIAAAAEKFLTAEETK